MELRNHHWNQCLIDNLLKWRNSFLNYYYLFLQILRQLYSVIPWRIVASYDKDDPGGLHHWLPSSHHENIWNNRVRGPNKDLQLDCVTNIQKVIISDHGEGERLRCSCSNSQIKCRTGDVLLRYQLNRQNSE